MSPSPIPSPHRLQVRRYIVATEADELGNYPEGLADPVDWMVRSVDPVSNREPGRDHRDLATIAFTVHADKSALVPSYRDVVIYGGKEYPVDGAPDDWTMGPWANPAAGVTVWLKRVEG